MQETSIVEYMSKEAVKGNIQETLGRKSAQFIASVASLVSSNPAIARCDQRSILSSCLVAASLDLPINQNLGFAYIIPYGDSAQFQMGYKGFIQLAMRSGQFKTINVTNVKEGELTNNNRLTGEIEFTWIEGEARDKAANVGFVAYMELINGFTKQLYMSVSEIEKHAGRYSKAYKSKGIMNVWRDDFDVMAKKTVIKLLLAKYAPMTIDMQKATLADQAVIVDDQYQYPDNAPVDPSEIAKEKEQARITKHIATATTLEELEAVDEVLADYDQELRKQYDEKYALLTKRALA